MLLARETRQIAGFDVVLVPTGAATVTIRAVVNVGAAYEEPRIRGVAHFLEHLFFKGTQRRGYERLNRDIARIGDTNAYTDYDRTVFHIDTLGDAAVEAFETLCELLFEPLLNEDDLERERGVILEEWQAGRDSPWQSFYSTAMERVMPAPYNVPVIGSEETIRAIQAEDVRSFRATHYSRANIAFVLAGDLSQIGIEDIQRVLERVDAQAGTVNVLPTGVVKRARPAIVERIEHPSEQAIVSLWAPTLNEPQDRAQAHASEVLYNALGGGSHSILYDRIRDRLGLAYSVGAHEWTYSGIATGILAAACSRENVGRCLDEMHEVLRELASTRIDAELIDVSRRNIKYRLAQAENHPAGLAASFLDMHFATRTFMDTAQRGYRDFSAILDGPGAEVAAEVGRQYIASVLCESPTVVLRNA